MWENHNIQCKEREGGDRKKEGVVVGIEDGANITLFLGIHKVSYFCNLQLQVDTFCH